MYTYLTCQVPFNKYVLIEISTNDGHVKFLVVKVIPMA